ncbi:hypothetical protein [Streptomyces lavendulae]|uniref:hypothetical protein n=1 Tax=Streptomyces lavendulae TaxID=1914 RepID=UPI0038053C2D
MGLGEQAELGLSEDASADQAFQFEADARRVLRDDRQVEGLAEVSSSHRAAGIGKDGEDLLVGGVLGFGVQLDAADTAALVARYT